MILFEEKGNLLVRTDDFIEKNFKLLYISGVILGVLLSLIYANNQILLGDQMQMLEKGYMGAKIGVWINYGNVASVVGNVPGSLLSLFVGLPILVYDDPLSPMIFLIFLHIISLFLFDLVIKSFYKNSIRLLFLVIYLLNPWFLFENILYNPSYLFVFSALHFWSAFKMRENKSFFYSILHIFSIGFALQIHYSWVILPLISLYLYYKNIIKINWFGLICGGILIIVSLIPYLQSIINNPDIIQKHDNDRYIGWAGVHVYPVLKAFVYWFRFASTIFTTKLINGVNFNWVTSIMWLQIVLLYLWKVVLYTVGVLSIWFAFKANKYVYTKIKGKLLRDKNQIKLDTEMWIFYYLVGSLIAIFVSALASPIIFSYWHLIIIFPFALFPLLAKINMLNLKNSLLFKKSLFFLTIYFVIVNISAAMHSDKFSYKVSYRQQTLDKIASKYN